MNLSMLFDTIIINATEAKTLFSQGIETDAFNKLDEIVKTIQILKDFKDKCSLLQLPNTNNMELMEQITQETRKRKRQKIDKYPKIQKSNNNNNNNLITNPQQPTLLQENYPVQFSPSNINVENDLIDRLDEIFFGFLARVCSDLDASDSTGEKIHQTMTAKKLTKVTETIDFKQFKFRIRSFTNAFREELQRNGFTEEIIPEKKARHYLWQQRYISRFNEDGKKAKSKGSHVWIIEAKKTSDGGWIFKEFERRIAGPEPSPIAYIGLKYTYEPKIYDPQIRSPKVIFHSPWLPDWLSWEDNVLTGIPDDNAQECELTVIASYYHGDSAYKLEKTFYLSISRWNPQNPQDSLDAHIHYTTDTNAANGGLVAQYTPTTTTTSLASQLFHRNPVSAEPSDDAGGLFPPPDNLNTRLIWSSTF